MWITGAEKGNVQLFDEDSRALKIVVQRGFDAPFLDYFASVSVNDPSACGAALENADRVVVEDVASSAIFADQPSRTIRSMPACVPSSRRHW